MLYRCAFTLCMYKWTRVADRLEDAIGRAQKINALYTSLSIPCEMKAESNRTTELSAAPETCSLA